MGENMMKEKYHEEWTREETVLALDLYYGHTFSKNGKSNLFFFIRTVISREL